MFYFFTISLLGRGLRIGVDIDLIALLAKFFFFFQAEDGIRDATVTGVQTYALPISKALAQPPTAVEWCLPAPAAGTTPPPSGAARAPSRARRRPSRSPAPPPAPTRYARSGEIGRASCRERLSVRVRDEIRGHSDAAA